MAKKSEDLMKLDLYGILEVAFEATKKEITKAYRKRALKCHPDKNPDNPKAAEQFQQLSKALEILTDDEARKAYDTILKAREAAELRRQQLNSKRKKIKDDLEQRELAASREKDFESSAERNLKAQIERLRKEGSKLLEEEQERLKEELAKAQFEKDNISEETSVDIESTPARLKIRWKAKKADDTNGGYNENVLRDILEPHGEIIALLVSKKKNGSAIVEYASLENAGVAEEKETGLEENPLTITWLSGKPENLCPNTNNKDEPKVTSSGVGQTASSFPYDFMAANQFATVSSADRDFESVVLMRMRQAEERKRLIEQMNEEGD